MKAYKKFWFEASHTLPDNPQVHGHSYLVTVWVATSASSPVSLAAFKTLEWQLHRFVDHTHLNDKIPSPTMESIAAYLMDKGRQLIRLQNINVDLISIDVERPSLDFGVVT